MGRGRGMKLKDFKLNTSLVIPYFGGREKKKKHPEVKANFITSLPESVVQKVLKLCNVKVIK